MLHIKAFPTAWPSKAERPERSLDLHKGPEGVIAIAKN